MLFEIGGVQVGVTICEDAWSSVGPVCEVAEGGASAVLACSALRQAYRDRISRAGDVRYVHLAGNHDTIAERLAARKNHYMPPTLLASQLATLEAPTDAIVIDVSDAVPVQVAKIRAALKPNFGNA